MKNAVDLENRVKELIEMADKTLRNTSHGNMSSMVPYEMYTEFRTSSLSFIDNLYGVDHSFYTNFDTTVRAADPFYIEGGRGILKAIWNELHGGWIFSMKSIISAEIFSDFMEMAEHLLKSGYKDPAAVMVGSVLEENLRQLCRKHGIEVEEEKHNKVMHKKADRLNSDLAKAEVYNKLDQKSITSWLDLRNNAAHGKYEAYSIGQVTLMYSGVLDFISRTSN